MDGRGAVLQLQSRRIADLTAQLEEVTGERDVLLLELEQLRCQLELRELVASSPPAPLTPAVDTAPPGSAAGRRKQDTCLKRSRIHAGYELSTDLAERQVACLERRYGGRRARHAATTIQRAYRRYALSKKFHAITLSAKSERRLSRRFDVGSSWSPPAAPASATAPAHGHRHGVAADAGDYLHTSAAGIGVSAAAANASGGGGLMCPPPARPALNGSVENDSDLSDREYQSYSCLNDSTYLSEYFAPPPRGAHSPPAMCRLEEPAYLTTAAAAFQACEPRRTGRRPPPPSPAPPPPPLRSGSASCVPTVSSCRRLEGASSSSESSLASAGPVSTSSPVLRRRAQRSSSRSSDGRGLSRARSDTVTSAAAAAAGGGGGAASDRVDHHRPRHLAEPSRQTTHGGHAGVTTYKVPEIVRKRQYRVGLNLFNTKPERGIDYLMGRGFLDESPHAVARFLITRKGLSKQMIGEYLGDLQSPFCAAVLEAFAQELDFYNMQLDSALRKFQTYFRLPGEAQKIERLMEVFGQRYCQCNHEFVAGLKTPDTVFVLAFAIIMLNTDLFTPNIKPERKMKLDDFIKNLRGIDDGADVEPRLLAGIYERVRAQQFRAGADHVTPVLKVQQTTIGKKPPLALPHRRLVCYCRLYEVPDVSKKERPGVHQREVFLFNDLMLVTKIFSKKKSAMTYSCRQSLPLAGLSVSAFDLPYYPYGIRLSQRVDGKVLLTFNARNEHDRTKFCEDLRESILEMDEMEALRIDAGLERQKVAGGIRHSRATENRDSGVADVEADTSDGSSKASGSGLKRSALSNSLLDVAEVGGRPQRRGSVGSLDSGMSVSFQSSSTAASGQTASPPTAPAHAAGRHRRGAQ